MRAAILLTGLLPSIVLAADYLQVLPGFGDAQYLGLELNPQGGSLILVQNITENSGDEMASRIRLQEGSLILNSTYDYMPRVVQAAVTNTSKLVIADGFLTPPYVNFDFTSNGTLVYGDDVKQDGFCLNDENGGSAVAYIYLAPKGSSCKDINRATFKRVQKD